VVPEQKPEIKINKELSHTILGVKFALKSYFNFLNKKKIQIATPLISD
jgi:hypothetical protein